MRLADKVHLRVKTVGSTIYAYLSYNYLENASPDGKRHIKGLLDIWNITNETAPVQVRTIVTSGSNTNDTEFAPVFLASQYATKFAWGFYLQAGGNPCDTR